MPFFSCEMTFETFTRTPKNKFFPRQFVSLTFFSTTVSPLGTQTYLHRYRQGAAKFKAVYSSAFLKSRVASLRLLNLQAECGMIVETTKLKRRGTSLESKPLTLVRLFERKVVSNAVR